MNALKNKIYCYYNSNNRTKSYIGHLYKLFLTLQKGLIAKAINI